MFGLLKNIATETLLTKALDKYADTITDQLQQVKNLQPDDITNNNKYMEKVIQPALNSIIEASDGATKVIPDFDKKLSNALYHMRDELIIVDAKKVDFVDNFQTKLKSVLLDGFKKSV